MLKSKKLRWRRLPDTDDKLTALHPVTIGMRNECLQRAEDTENICDTPEAQLELRVKRVPPATAQSASGAAG
jgi:hypothetical protein